MAFVISKGPHREKEFLDDTITNNIKNFFSGVGDGVLSDSEASEVVDLFDLLKERKWRLECDCIETGVARPLLLAAQPCTLKRMPSPPNPEHATNCVFRSEVRPTRINPSRDVPDDSLLVHGPFRDLTEHGARPHRVVGSKQVRRDSGISRVLFKIIEESGINIIYPDQFSKTGRGQKYILRKISGIFLEKRNSIYLRDFLALGIEYGSAIRKINELKEKIENVTNWPASSRPQGFFCGIAQNFEYDSRRECYSINMVGWNTPLFIETRPQVFAESDADLRSPYIIIVSYSAPDRNTKRPIGMRCYMQPCYAIDNWLPVDSNNERKTLDLIFEFREKIKDEFEIQVKKPVFNSVYGRTGEICRPDFILTVYKNREYSHQIAIETMGITKDEYYQSKLRTHKIMKKRFGTLIQHDMTKRDPLLAYRAEQLFLQELKDAVLRRDQPRYQSLV